MLNRFRYKYDIFNTPDFNEERSLSNRYYINLLSNSMKVTGDIFPNIKDNIDKILLNLNIDDDFQFFITSENTTPNAHCLTINTNSALVVIHSRLVDLLSDVELMFIIGHEIGHHYYKHSHILNSDNLDTTSQYLLLDKQRKMELSCDRMGLICVKDFDVAARAILKMVSGLGDKHIKNNFQSYLAQLKELKKLGMPDEKDKTHNSWLLRMQALKLFSKSHEYNQYINNNNGDYTQDEVDEMINTGMIKITGIDPNKILKIKYRTYISFIIADILEEDLQFTSSHEEILAKNIDNETFNKLIKYMSGTNIKNFKIKIQGLIKEISLLPDESKTTICDEVWDVVKLCDNEESTQKIFEEFKKRIDIK